MIEEEAFAATTSLPDAPKTANNPTGNEALGEVEDPDNSSPNNTKELLKDSVPLAGYTDPSEKGKVTGENDKDTLGNKVA